MIRHASGTLSVPVVILPKSPDLGSSGLGKLSDIDSHHVLPYMHSYNTTLHLFASNPVTFRTDFKPASTV